MTCGTEPDALLMQRLNRYPPLRARVERLLGVVEDAAGDSLQADAAERRVIEELRQLGQEALTAWAERNLDKSAAEATAKPGIRGGGKCDSPGGQSAPQRGGHVLVRRDRSGDADAPFLL